MQREAPRRITAILVSRKNVPTETYGDGCGHVGCVGCGYEQVRSESELFHTRPPFRQWVLGKGIDPLAQGESMEARLSLGI